MTRFIDQLRDIASAYDAVVLDQWGVLHDGTTPYTGAPEAVAALNTVNVPVAILSNSGKRAAPNAERIAGMGFSDHRFDFVMTSGEALWQDIAGGRIPHTSFFAIERAPGDASAWAEGLADVTLTSEMADAEAVLLMGLPDGSDKDTWEPTLSQALSLGLTIYCSNPDKASPRAGGRSVVSPGSLADTYLKSGGHVVFYGKPHRPIFSSLKRQLGATSLLMVGDSLEHDIAGAHGAGWDSLLVRNGLYKQHFVDADPVETLTGLCTHHAVEPPTFCIGELA